MADSGLSVFRPGFPYGPPGQPGYAPRLPTTFPNGVMPGLHTPDRAGLSALSQIQLNPAVLAMLMRAAQQQDPRHPAGYVGGFYQPQPGIGGGYIPPTLRTATEPDIGVVEPGTAPIAAGVTAASNAVAGRAPYLHAMRGPEALETGRGLPEPAPGPTAASSAPTSAPGPSAAQGAIDDLLSSEVTPEDKWLALAMGGFGMAASQKPFLGALGEGGMAGLSAYRDARREALRNRYLGAQLQMEGDKNAATTELARATLGQRKNEATDLTAYRDAQLMIERDKVANDRAAEAARSGYYSAYAGYLNQRAADPDLDAVSGGRTGDQLARMIADSEDNARAVAVAKYGSDVMTMDEETRSAYDAEYEKQLGIALGRRGLVPGTVTGGNKIDSAAALADARKALAKRPGMRDEIIKRLKAAGVTPPPDF